MKKSEIHIRKTSYGNSNKFDTLLFWILGFCVAMFSSISLTISFVEDTMHRISASEMPENHAGFILVRWYNNKWNQHGFSFFYK